MATGRTRFRSAASVAPGSEDNGIFVVQAGPKYELLAENPMGEIVMATPAISDGMVFVRTIRHVYGIGE